MVTDISDLSTYLIKYRKELQMLAEDKIYKNFKIQPKLLYFCENFNSCCVEANIERSKMLNEYRNNPFKEDIDFKKSSYRITGKNKTEVQQKVNKFLSEINEGEIWFCTYITNRPIYTPVLFYFECNEGYYVFDNLDKNYSLYDKIGYVSKKDLKEKRNFYTLDEIKNVLKELEK